MASTPHTVSPKARLFLLDAATARPLRGVCVSLAIEFDVWPNGAPSQSHVEAPDDGPNRRRLELGVLRSDHVGYVSFDLRNMARGLEKLEKVEVAHVWVEPVRAPDQRVDVGTALLGGARTVPVSLEVEPSPGVRDMPSIQNPDADDWAASPRSFANVSMQSVGSGGCEELLISTASVRSFQFTQVVREPRIQPLSLMPASTAPCEEKGAAATPLCYRFGALVEYAQEWHPVGHGLGEVLYTLPLAPCETVRLAIVDWSRNDQAVRGEDLTATEQLSHNQHRDRAIDEVVAGAVSEWQRGGSVMAGAAGSYSSGAFSLSATAGGIYSTSAGDRNATADTRQRLADGVSQATTNARRLQSTVVVQASQAEQEKLQTRAVTNHNHCHALTVLYYEVVRHFRVQTRVVSARDAILVRHPDQHFTLERVLRDGHRIRPLLSDPALQHALDTLLRPDTSLPPTEARPTTSRFVVNVRSGDGSGGLPTTWLNEVVRFQVLTTEGEVLSFPLARSMATSGRAAADRLFVPGSTNTFTVDLPRSIPRASIAQIGLHWQLKDFLEPGGGDPNARLHVTRFECLAVVHGETSSALDPLFSGGVDQFFVDDSDWWVAAAAAPAPPTPSADARAITRLLQHLEQRRQELNRQLWLSEPPDQRAAWLDRYVLQHAGLEGRLLDLVENRVVDVIGLGEYIALPLAGTSIADKLVVVDDVTDERILSLPTRGAFAEAKLANCNACEEIDATRYWDWQQSPCDCDPPQINPLTAGSRDRATSATPSAVPGSTVGVVTPEAAPAPTGLANVLNLLGQSNLFRDMSGRAELAGVLTHLVDGAVQLEIEQVRRGNTDPKRETAAPAAGTAGASGSGAAPRASGAAEQPRAASVAAGTPANDDARYRYALAAVQRAAAQGTITEEQQRALTAQLVEGQVAQTTSGAGTAAAGGSDETVDNSNVDGSLPAPDPGPPVEGTASSEAAAEFFAQLGELLARGRPA
jgi:hypothetical protein